MRFLRGGGTFFLGVPKLLPPWTFCRSRGLPASPGRMTLTRAPDALLDRCTRSAGGAPFQDELGVSGDFEFQVTMFVEDTRDPLSTRAHVCRDLRQPRVAAGHDAHMAHARLVAQDGKAELPTALL